MNINEINLSFLNEEQASAIPSPTERLFALRVLEVGCEIAHQIPVGDSTIDFFIINPKNPRSEGRLVETTQMSREQMCQNTITKKVKGKKRRVANDTGRRKKRQEAAMESSGLPWTIMFGDNLNKIFKR